MTCASCVNTVESAVKKLPGVERAVVNLLANHARVTFKRSAVTPNAIAKAMNDIGFEAHEVLRSSTGRAILSVPTLDANDVHAIVADIQALSGITEVSVRSCDEHPKMHRILEVAYDVTKIKIRDVLAHAATRFCAPLVPRPPPPHFPNRVS
jgi:copper chaperone CopZ